MALMPLPGAWNPREATLYPCIAAGSAIKNGRRNELEKHIHALSGKLFGVASVIERFSKMLELHLGIHRSKRRWNIDKRACPCGQPVSDLEELVENALESASPWSLR